MRCHDISTQTAGQRTDNSKADACSIVIGVKLYKLFEDMVGFRRGDADTVVLDDEVQETIHKVVEEFVGNAEPSDDLTKMCISSKLFFINQLCLSKQNRSELCELPSSLFLPFTFYAMHEVTPSAVAMADSILMAV